MQRIASSLRPHVDMVTTATSLLVLLVMVFCHTSQPLTCFLTIVFALSLVTLASLSNTRNHLIHVVVMVAAVLYVHLLFNRFTLAPAADTWYYSGTAEMVKRGEFCPGSILPLDPFVDIGQPSASLSLLQYPIGLVAKALGLDTLTVFLLSGLPVLALLIYGIYMLFSYSFTRKHGLVVAICYIFVFIWHTPNFWTSEQYTYPMELLTMSWPPVQVQAFLVWMLYFGIKGIKENKNSHLLVSGMFWALAMWTRTYAYPAPVLLLAMIPYQVKSLQSAHSLQQGKLHFLKTLLLPHIKIVLTGIILSMPIVILYRIAITGVPSSGFLSMGIMTLNSLKLWPSFFGWISIALACAGLLFSITKSLKVPLCAVLILWLALSIIGSVPNPIPFTWKWGYNLNVLRLLAPLGFILLVQYLQTLHIKGLTRVVSVSGLVACAVIMVCATVKPFDYFSESRDHLVVGVSGFSRTRLYTELSEDNPTFPYSILLWLDKNGDSADVVACDSTYVSMHIHPYTPCYPASIPPAFFSYLADLTEQYQRWKSIEYFLNQPNEPGKTLECLSKYRVSYVILVQHEPEELPQFQSPSFEVVTEQPGATLLRVHHVEPG